MLLIMQGFVIVSATKDYYPILVDVQEGQYDRTRMEGCGAGIFMDMYRSQIEKIMLDKAAIGEQEQMIIYNQWIPFEKQDFFVGMPTKSMNDELIDLVEASMEQWESEGKNYYYLGQGRPEYMSEEMYEQFIQMASEQANENYDYMENSFILEYSYGIQHNISPLMHTAWGDFSFIINNNPHTTYYTGSSPIAVGQIMAFHRYPINLDWNLIISNADGFSRDEFLKDITMEMSNPDNMTPYSNHVTIDEIRTYLSAKGYTSQKVTHSYSSVEGSLLANRPVLMTGVKRTTNASILHSHTWVCDGIREFPNEIIYELKVLSYYDPMTYETAYTASVPFERSSIYHMNWGEYGYGNGYYTDAEVDYPLVRTNLVNIKRGIPIVDPFNP